jgi:hypothetical protein
MTRASAPARVASPDQGRQSARGREPPAGEPAAPLAERVQALQRYAGNRALARGLWRAASGRCACGGKAGPDGECAACRARRLALQRSAAGPARATAPPIVQRVLATRGRPLEPGLRADMEARLSAHPVRRASGLLAAGEISRPSDPPEREAERVAGAVVDGPAQVAGERRVDLAHVRIHTGRQAADSARAVGANAYTVGPHVVFGDGRFGPDSRAGRRLLAHELTHVLQQGEGAGQAVMRQACPHDGKGSAKCGYYWKFDEAPEENSGVDTRIVRLGFPSLPSKLGGTWVSEVSTPENRLKRESKGQSGRVDGLKVIENGRGMRLQVVEIKSRSVAGGGCAQATVEAAEYVRLLQQIAPRIVAISRVAAERGGFAPRQNPLAADRDALLKEGIDAEGKDHPAWRFFSSLQDKLGRVFTKGFDTLVFDTNADGTPGTTYDVGGPTINVDCTRRGRKTTGTIRLQFQVNGRGGVSYNCIKNCPEDDEERKRKQKELGKPKEEEKEKGKETRPQIEAPPPGQRKQPPVKSPPSKQPPAEAPVEPSYIVEGVTAIAILHRTAMATLDAAKRRALRKAADGLVKTVAKEAPELAARIDGKAIEAFGTKGYGKHIIAEVERYEAKALKSGAKRMAGRLGKKVLSKGVLRVLGPLGVLLTVKDALALADHVSKGGEISIGFGPEASLEGSTKIKKKGKERAKSELKIEAKLKDTKIDMDVSGLPKLTGGGQIDADNVTIRSPGALSDGTPVTVNFRSKLKDTTITITHKGRIEGGGVVLDSAVDISGSKIVIDLPPGAKQAKYEGGKPFVAKNADLRITQTGGKPGAEAGEPITGKHETTGEPGEPGGAEKKGPPGAKGGGAREGQGVPIKPAEEEAAEPAGAKPSDKYPKLSADTRKRIDAQAPARRLLENIVGTDPKGVKLDDKTVNRFLNIVEGLDDKQVDALIAGKKKITTETEEQFFAALQAAVTQVRKAKPGEPGAPGDPGGKPGKTQSTPGPGAKKAEKAKKPKKEEKPADYYKGVPKGDSRWVWDRNEKDPRKVSVYGIDTDGTRYHGTGTIRVLPTPPGAPPKIKVLSHEALVDDHGKVRVRKDRDAGKTLPEGS